MKSYVLALIVFLPLFSSASASTNVERINHQIEQILAPLVDLDPQVKAIGVKLNAATDLDQNKIDFALTTTVLNADWSDAPVQLALNFAAHTVPNPNAKLLDIVGVLQLQTTTADVLSMIKVWAKRLSAQDWCQKPLRESFEGAALAEICASAQTTALAKSLHEVMPIAVDLRANLLRVADSFIALDKATAHDEKQSPQARSSAQQRLSQEIDRRIAIGAVEISEEGSGFNLKLDSPDDANGEAFDVRHLEVKVRSDELDGGATLVYHGFDRTAFEDQKEVVSATLERFAQGDEAVLGIVREFMRTSYIPFVKEYAHWQGSH